MKKDYVILCPTWKRVIYKSIGIILGIVLIGFEIYFPETSSNYHHFTTVGIGGAIWMVTRAGFETKKGPDNEKNT